MLFTDIEGSTRLAAKLGSGWAAVLADHHALVGGAIAAEGGFVEGTEGDAFFATFEDASAAARAAIGSLRALRAHSWPQEVGELRVRMGLHVGRVERRATGYVGLEVHRAARVAAAAHGGQLLLTSAARALAGEVVAVEPLGLHRLKDFPAAEALFCAVVDGRGAAAFPPPRTQELRPTNLPAGLPALVGRDDELAQVRAALMGEGERLVTLTGRGGVGKTSLALIVASALLDEHPGGVWLVGLATVTSAEEVLPAVASTIGAEGEVFGTPLDAIVARLGERGPTLLVIDNLEHVLPVAPALARLLDSLPELRMLVTSQAPLRLAAERCVPLDALDDHTALALIERVALRRGARLSKDAAEQRALLDVAHLLDGLPLALELAAARLGLLSAAQLRERLHDSSDLLSDAGGARPERQRSLRATVGWTLGLLAEDSRALFVRMGAFAGPVELEDLELVAGGDGLDVLEALAGLLDVALVRRVESGDGRVRFGLPEALRQVATALLDAAPDGDHWRREHARRQLELVWPARTTWVPLPVYRAAVAADVEAAAALRWAGAHGDPLAPALAAARASLLHDFGRVREALAVLEPLLEHPSGDPAVDGIALAAHALALTVVDRNDEARTSAQRAVTIAVDTETRAWTLVVAGLVDVFGDRGEAGMRASEEATALAGELGAAALAGALIYEAQAHVIMGELDRAASQLDEAERIGSPVDCKTLLHLDTVRGDLALESGRAREALDHYARSLESAQARGDDLQIMFDLWGVARGLAAMSEDRHAIEVTGLAEAHSREISGPAGQTLEHALNGDVLVAALERLDPALVADLKARGRAVPAGGRVTRACQLAVAPSLH
jgi:predicted ATPase/class 3 adenylate cyclase